MKTELKKITIRDLVKGYTDDQEKGVRAFSGKLNVRPPYQRDEVINSVMGGFPLNVMYWVALDDGTFELLDGQQRTIRKFAILTNLGLIISDLQDMHYTLFWACQDIFRGA